MTSKKNARERKETRAVGQLNGERGPPTAGVHHYHSNVRGQTPEIFVQLRSTLDKWAESLSHTQRHLDGASTASEDTESCMQIVRYENQIKQQLMNVKTDLRIRGFSNEDIDRSLNVSLDIANESLENEMNSVKIKELALLRIQTFYTLQNVLQKDDFQKQPIMAVMKHSMDICKQILAVSSSNDEMEEELYNIRKQRMELKLKQQELFKKLKNSERASSNIREVELKMHELGRENIQSVSNKIIIIQEVFQRLIMSAQVDWAQDPHLKSLLLRMRNPVV